MMYQEQASLKGYNSFGIDAIADRAAIVNSVDELGNILKDSPLKGPLHIIGGGSNVLLTKPVEGLALLNRITGKTIIKEDDDHVWIEVAGGENWHSFVLYAIENGWAGIENLALIPGTVGASPIQNIGAYGAEVREVIETVHAMRLEDGERLSFTNSECAFGYRDSIFKNALKDKVFITSVVYRLNKKPDFKTTYGAISQELEQMGVAELTIGNIARAVINIRQSKLPDPAKLGNAGSFFKNPTVARSVCLGLQERYPTMPFYNVSEDLVKIPAGWLIESCGLKGYRQGDAGVHQKQALVLVNYGSATGAEILALSQKVIDTVQDKFGIALEREVNIW